MPDRIKVPAAFWIGVDRLGIRRSMLLRGAELPMAAGQEGASLSTAQFFGLWHSLEQLGGTEVGLQLAQGLDGAVMPPSFLVAYHARDLRDALTRVARFKSLCAPEELTIAPEGDAIVIETTWPYALGDVPFSLTDATMAALVGVPRTGADDNYQPLRLELRRPRSGAIARHFGCPIQWNAAADRLFLRASDLALPFRTYNAELAAMLDMALAAIIEQNARASSLSQQVQWLIRRALTGGRPEIRSVARELALSERSLQRRLHEEGRSFQALLSDTRHQLAREYLIDRSLDITEIAYMLGYDDQASFYRAFQRWENQTPTQWRDRQAQKGAPGREIAAHRSHG